jgi:hypothetical protein
MAVSISLGPVSGEVLARGGEERDAGRARDEHRRIGAPFLLEETPQAEHVCVPLGCALDAGDRECDVVEPPAPP